MSQAADEVIVAVEGGTGRLRLNRPKAIHALTLGMCHAMTHALEDWRGDADIALILLDHAAAPDGDPKLSRGFCAGGDIRLLAESGAGDGVAARLFFHDEYQLNHLLFTYAKPTCAVMDGIVMGGGVGIALPCRFRIATERTRFAMPESGIGLFPDVGGGWHLSRLPGRVGQYLALTGARLDGADCLALGIATHYVPSDALEALKARLIADPRNAEAILADAAVAPPLAAIVGQRDAIDRLFAADVYEEVLAALAADGAPWAAEQLATLAGKSPQTCKVSLRLLRQGRDHVDFADEMRVEYRVACHIVQRHDFLEGVRALIVEKDNAPRWDPPTAEGVTDHLLDTIFSPLAADEEWVPRPI